MQPEKIDLEPNTQEWLDYRKTMYNASEAGAVMCVNPWFPKNIHDLVALKKGIKVVEYNSAMKHGHDNEANAVAALEKMLGVKGSAAVFSRGKFSASLDWFHNSVSGIQQAEIKCPVSATSDYWMAALSCNVKEYAPSVYWQIQQQLYVTGQERSHFFVWSKENQAHCIVERHEPDIKILLFAWENFENLMNKKESDGLSDAAEIYKAKAFEMEVLKAELEAAKSALLSLAGNNYDGNGLKIRTTSRIGAVDYGKIPELKGIDLDQYRKAPTTTTTIKIEKE